MRGKDADIDVVALDDVLVADRLIGRNLLRRHFPTQLLLQNLHRLERMIHRLLADHQAEAREVASNHVVERAVPGMTFDVLEQERGRLLAADEVSDRCRLEIGIDFRGDALELPERLDLFQPSVEIAGVGAASDRLGLGFLALWLGAGRAHRDAHVHGGLHLVLLPIERSLARLEVKCTPGGVTGRRHGAKGAAIKSPAHRPGVARSRCTRCSEARHDALEAQKVGE